MNRQFGLVQATSNLHKGGVGVGRLVCTAAVGPVLPAMVPEERADGVGCLYLQ